MGLSPWPRFDDNAILSAVKTHHTDTRPAWRLPSSKALTLAALLLWLIVGAIAVNRQLTNGSADFREFWEVTRHTVHQYADERTDYVVPFTYPPLFHLLLAAFSWMPLALGASLWFLFCSGCAVSAIWMLRRIAGTDESPLPARYTALAVFMALGVIANDLIMGNANLVVLFLIVSMLYAVQRGRAGVAGLALAAGAAFKILPGIFLVYFLYKRQYRVVAHALLGCMLCFLVLPMLFMGPARGFHLVSQWTRQMLPMLQEKSGAKELWYEKDSIYRGTNQSLVAVVNRFLRPVPSIRGQQPMGTVNVADLPRGVVNAVYIALVAGLLATAAWLVRIPGAPGHTLPAHALEYGLVVLLMLLLSKVTWVNYFVHMIVAYFAAAACLHRNAPGATAHRYTRNAFAVSFLLSTLGGLAIAQAYAFPLLGALTMGAALAWNLHRERQLLHQSITIGEPQ
ncbi:MAG: DUF2029 domain-containing protein [Candidatus Hydrogenedentes bacterium]|nr:DUF2029 domain-containing protein [Candidatus Hydrogenedentota bacterium]